MSEWNLMSEKVPTRNDVYMVTMETGFGSKERYIGIVRWVNNLHSFNPSRFHQRYGGWVGYDPEYGDFERQNVIAWCELPEPYKAESEEG